jgi:hypothetical protein
MDQEKRVSKKPLIVTGLVALVATLLLALTAYVAFGGFSAAITNNSNSYSSGTLTLQEVVNGGTPCLSSPNTANGITTNINSACTSNDFGGSTSPGAEPTTPPTVTSNNVVLTNDGSLLASSMAVTPGTTCTVTGNPVGTGANALSTGSDTAGFCSKVDIQIETDNAGTYNCLYGGPSGAACPATMSNTYNLSTLATNGAITLATNVASQGSVTVVVNVGLDSSATNADQGLTATLPLTWSEAQ